MTLYREAEPWSDGAIATWVVPVEPDYEAADKDSSLMVCIRCQGTGNEFYSMYRKCSGCDGVGAIELVDSEGIGETP